jgi:sec-independent protein translocase protein TatA
MGMPSGIELLVIAGVILLLFGGKKIPELAKGLGSGIKNFKKAVKDDEVADVATDAAEKIEGKVENAAKTASEDSQKA